MSGTVNNPASCEMLSVSIGKKKSAANIHREIVDVYGSSFMCKGKVCQWCYLFREGRTNVHNKDCSGCPTVIQMN